MFMPNITTNHAIICTYTNCLPISSITIIHLILCCNSIRMVLPAVLYSNRAQCHLNKSDWQSALNDCNEAMARCLEGQLQYLFLQGFDNVSAVPFLLWWTSNNYPHYLKQGHPTTECFQSTVFLYSEIFRKSFFFSTNSNIVVTKCGKHNIRKL